MGEAQLKASAKKGLVVEPVLARSVSDEQRRGRIVAAMDGLTPGPKDVQMPEGKQWDIRDVAEIIEAKYGYESLTARLKDVTTDLKKLQRGSDLMLCKADFKHHF